MCRFSEALGFSKQKIDVLPEIVHDPSSLLAYLLPLESGSLGNLPAGVGASVPFTEYEAEAGSFERGRHHNLTNFRPSQ